MIVTTGGRGFSVSSASLISSVWVVAYSSSLTAWNPNADAISSIMSKSSRWLIDQRFLAFLPLLALVTPALIERLRARRRRGDRTRRLGHGNTGAGRGPARDGPRTDRRRNEGTRRRGCRGRRGNRGRR